MKDLIIALYRSILTFVPILLSIYLISKNNYKLIRLLIVLSLIFLAITSITSIYGLVQFPFASRQIATGMKNDPNALNIYAKMNIGGFSYVYMIPVILPMIVALYLTKNLKFILFIFFTLPLVFFVYKSQYTLGIISIIFVIISLFIFYNFSFKKLILVFYSVIIIFLIFNPISSDQIQELANKQPYEVSVRLNALIDFAEGRRTSSDAFVGRQTRYLNSINTFFSYPILGSRFFKTGMIGGHSFILDMAAGYGLTGIIALYLFYIHILRIFIKPFKHQPYYGYMMLSLIISIFLSIVNTSPNIFAIGFFIPIVAYSIEYKNNIEIMQE